MPESQAHGTAAAHDASIKVEENGVEIKKADLTKKLEEDDGCPND